MRCTRRSRSTTQGRIRQTGLETYRVPLALDVVPVEVHLHEGAPSRGPLGAKGAGEVPILNVAATVASARRRRHRPPARGAAADAAARAGDAARPRAERRAAAYRRRLVGDNVLMRPLAAA